MTQPDAKRPASVGTGPVESSALGGAATHSLVAVATTCPLACPPSCPWRCPTDISTELIALVDETLRRGTIVADGCRLLVPDVIVAECEANGRVMPTTSRIARADGRAVHVLRNAVSS